MVKDGVDGHQHIAGVEGEVKKTATGTALTHGCWREAERNCQQWKTRGEKTPKQNTTQNQPSNPEVVHNIWISRCTHVQITHGLCFVMKLHSLLDHYSMCLCKGQHSSWVKTDQLAVTCFIISLYNAQHVSDVNTSILRSLRLIYWVISWVVLLWFNVCCCYVEVWLWWCGIRMKVSACIRIPHHHSHTTT